VAGVPVKVGALTVPAGVPALSAEVVSPLPVNVGALFVPLGVMDVGETSAAVVAPSTEKFVVENVIELPVKVGALTVPVAVTVWLCVPKALPVKVGTLLVPAGVYEFIVSVGATAGFRVALAVEANFR
jgi:hypothetical protein